MENCKELFINAFMEAEQISNLEFMNTKNADIIFSKAFEQKMDKLLKKDKRIHFSTRRKIRNGLIAAIIAIIIAFTGLMSITATRTPFVEFFKTEGNGFVEIDMDEYSTPPVERIETEYELTAIPDEFTLKTYQKEELGVFVIWANDQDEEIVFSQDLLDTHFSIDSEHGYRELTKNGYTAYMIYNERGSMLLWRDDYYWFQISVPGSLNDELMSMSENVSEKN